MLSLFAVEAKKYFMLPKNYFAVSLPPYFDFGPVLKQAEDALNGHELLEYYVPEKLRESERVNFELPYSKDGGYAWRTFRLVHPAIYVELVRLLTEPHNWERVRERINLFRKQKSVKSISLLPGAEYKRNATASSILKWWNGVEEESLKLSIYYNYVLETDILECYGTISTDLIALALDGPRAGREGFGYKIGKLLADSEQGQKVGIPQGNVLVDFLAEIVLGYIDVAYDKAIKNEKLKRSEFTILRYRDDYRIFTQDELTARKMVRILAETLAKFGLKLNPQKTILHDDIIMSARKPDKVYWESRKSLFEADGDGEMKELSIQKHLLRIYELSLEHPNSGSVQRALSELYEKRIFKLEHRPRDAYQILGITMNIMVKNPRVSQICVAIMSKIMWFNPGISRNCLVDKTLTKARMVPNAEYIELCLQRLTVKTRPGKRYRNKLSKMVSNVDARLWNSSWLDFKIMDTSVVDRKKIKKMDFVVPIEEVAVFMDYLTQDDGFNSFLN